jgi:hypothetical protein
LSQNTSGSLRELWYSSSYRLRASAVVASVIGGPVSIHAPRQSSANADGKPARTWPIQFLVRRTAHHVMDHAWEIEDRDPAS